MGAALSAGAAGETGSRPGLRARPRAGTPAAEAARRRRAPEPRHPEPWGPDPTNPTPANERTHHRRPAALETSEQDAGPHH